MCRRRAIERVHTLAGAALHLPLDVAADARNLLAARRIAGKQRSHGCAGITAGHGHIVSRSSPIELTAVGEFSVLIEDIQFGSASRVEGTGDRLALVIKIGKQVASL